MIETAIRVTDGYLSAADIEKIMGFGRELLAKPVEKFEGVEKVLGSLRKQYRLVMATKGDLLDQERKLEKSGLADYFHHIEIMSAKKIPDFKKLIDHLDVSPADFIMVGNSLKSDIIPVLDLGGRAFHIPYHVTWDHEKIEHTIENDRFHQVTRLEDLLDYL